MENNLENWGNLKYPKKSLSSLVSLSLLMIPGIHRIEEEGIRMMKNKNEKLTFANSAELFSFFIIAFIILISVALIIRIIKNDSLKDFSGNWFSPKGILDNILGAFIFMILFSFVFYFSLGDKILNFNFGAFVGFIVYVVFFILIKDTTKIEFQNENNNLKESEIIE